MSQPGSDLRPIDGLSRGLVLLCGHCADPGNVHSLRTDGDRPGGLAVDIPDPLLPQTEAYLKTLGWTWDTDTTDCPPGQRWKFFFREKA